jgi:hypothetical protein
MPLISYSCACGFSTKKYLKSAKDSAVSIICEKCGSEAKKVFGNTSSSYKVTIDTPGMARRIEIDPNIMEINDERSATDYTEDQD